MAWATKDTPPFSSCDMGCSTYVIHYVSEQTINSFCITDTDHQYYASSHPCSIFVMLKTSSSYKIEVKDIAKFIPFNCLRYMISYIRAFKSASPKLFRALNYFTLIFFFLCCLTCFDMAIA